MYLNIHNNIKKKLNHFNNNVIPNIIFYGKSGSGKKTLLFEFINKIYDSNNDNINKYVLTINCALNKGIKCIREDLVFFAKININKNIRFKSIILLNANKLTNDAQSVLRRCIEIYCHNTRFFFVVEDKYKILKPILSRLCEIYVNYPIVNNKIINLYVYNKFNFQNSNIENIKKYLNNKVFQKDNLYLVNLVDKLYNKGFCSIDIENYILESNIKKFNKNLILIYFNNVKRNLINEKFAMLYLIILFRNNYNINNINII